VLARAHPAIQECDRSRFVHDKRWHDVALQQAPLRVTDAAELLALPDVDGALVGGASLGAEAFAEIVAAAVALAA